MVYKELAALCCYGLITLTAAACQPRPLSIPIEDVDMSGITKMRGVALGVGSNYQNISFFVGA